MLSAELTVVELGTMIMTRLSENRWHASYCGYAQTVKITPLEPQNRVVSSLEWLESGRFLSLAQDRAAHQERTYSDAPEGVKEQDTNRKWYADRVLIEEHLAKRVDRVSGRDERAHCL